VAVIRPEAVILSPKDDENRDLGERFGYFECRICSPYK